MSACTRCRGRGWITRPEDMRTEHEKGVGIVFVYPKRPCPKCNATRGESGAFAIGNAARNAIRKATGGGE